MSEVYEHVRVCEVTSERGFYNPERADREDGHLARGQRCIVKGRDTDSHTYDGCEHGQTQHAFEITLETVYIHTLPEPMTVEDLLAYLDDERREQLLNIDQSGTGGVPA